MRSIRSSVAARYAAAAACTILAVLARSALEPLWGVELPYITLYPAVMVSAWLGGMGPGLLATGMSAAAAAYLWLSPVESLAVAELRDLVGLAVFVTVGISISTLNEASKRAMTAVTQTQERLRTTLIGIGDGVIATDHQGLITEMNPVAEGLTGYAIQDARGRPLDEVFVILNEDTRQPAVNPVPRVLREGIIAGLANHTILRSRDGREVPIDDSAAPIRSPDGSVVGAVLIFRDVSGRRRADRERTELLGKERAARLEAERLSQMVLQVQQVTDVALTNLDAPDLMRELLARVCTALKCDSAAVFLLDASRAFLRPTAFHGFDSRTREAVNIPLGQGIAGSIAATGRGRIINDLREVDGVVDPFLRRHVRSLIAVPLAVGDRIIGVIKAGSADYREFQPDDLRLLGLVAERLALTIERRHAEEAVKESEQRFRSLADNAPMLIWVNSGSGCEYANRAYLEFLNLTLPELQRMDLSDHVHPDDAAGYVGSYTAALKSRSRFDAQFRFRRADGEYRWLKSLGVPRFTAEGDFLGFVGCSVDITDIKRAEEELKDTDRRKDEFLAVLSHELRNPINAVVGWAHILKAGGLGDEKARHGLDVIERNARAEAQLVESLLDLSRISTGKLDLDMKPVDLKGVATAAVENARPAARTKGVDLALRTPPDPAVMVGDAARLEQLLTNLLSNAVKFTPPGGHIRVELDRVSSRVQVRVSDDGEGIPPEFLPFVFERFRQADSGRERQHGGLGLGLSIVRELVQAHDGTVTAESMGPGRGSTFTVNLPVRAVTVDVPQPADIAAAGANAAVNGRRVLVVDDDEDARDLLKVTLEGYGTAVRTAASAAEGLQCLGQEPFDVLVADIGMPDDDGYSFISTIRERERDSQLPRLPAVALTAFAGTTDREQAFRAGFDAHLPKPVDPAALVRAIARISQPARA